MFDYDKEREAELCYRTTDTEHPGVARLDAQKQMYLAGKVTVFERATPPFPELAMDPAETRAAFAERGWKRVVGFQTRNPIHRAHEYLTKVALETVDGLLIHPLVGDTKSDDVPAATRVDATTCSSTATTRATASSSRPSLRRCATPARAKPSGTRSAARTTAARTSSSAATMPAWATTTGHTTRSSSSTSSSRTSWTSSRCSSSTPSGATRCGAMASAKTCPHPRGTTMSSCRARRCARCSAHGELPPEEFSRPEVAEVLIEAYRG